MYIEPAFHEHLEVMVAVATADGASVDNVHVGANLKGAATDTETLLANLAAGGLLRERGVASGRTRAYRLARPPEEITPDEIATVADAADATKPVTPSTAAEAGGHLLSAAVQQHARRVLATFTLADLVASSSGRTDTQGPAAPSAGPAPGAVIPAPETDGPWPARLGITVAQLRRTVDAGDVPLVLDVRARPDSRWPAPPWAHWLPLHSLVDRLPERSSDTRIVTVCRLGVRSMVAASYLRACGFSRCDPLIGGLEAWNRGGG